MHLLIDILGWLALAGIVVAAVYVATGHAITITIGDDGE